jgi:nicotinamidase/pyrazinamidase
VREGFAVVVIEDACRGIDVQGSIAATRSSLAALRVAAIAAAEIAVTTAD